MGDICDTVIIEMLIPGLQVKEKKHTVYSQFQIIVNRFLLE